MSALPGTGKCSAQINVTMSQVQAQHPTADLDATKVAQTALAFLSLNIRAKTALTGITANFNANLPQGGGGVAANPGTFSGSALGANMAAWNDKFDKMGEIGASLDQMESQAQDLMKSPKKEDQIKGEQMMQAVTQIMEALIKAIQSMGDAAKHAIDASQSH